MTLWQSLSRFLRRSLPEAIFGRARWSAFRMAWAFRNSRSFYEGKRESLWTWYRCFRHKMTPAEAEAQRRDFVYGNCAIDNQNVTREMVDETAETTGGKA